MECTVPFNQLFPLFLQFVCVFANANYLCSHFFTVKREQPQILGKHSTIFRHTYTLSLLIFSFSFSPYSQSPSCQLLFYHALDRVCLCTHGALPDETQLGKVLRTWVIQCNTLGFDTLSLWLIPRRADSICLRSRPVCSHCPLLSAGLWGTDTVMYMRFWSRYQVPLCYPP